MSEHFVAETKKKERVHRILDLSRELEKKYYEKFVNETLDVIIEQTSDGISKGHTSNYILVNVDSSLKEGDKYPVKIESIDGLIVNGRVEKVE